MGTLWFGGNIYTLEQEKGKVDAVFTKNGRIVDVGSYETLTTQYSDEIIEKQNLQGHTLIPGLVDSHLHLIAHGEKLLRLDFSKTTNSSEIIQSIKKRAAEVKKGSWIIGEGWNENQLEDQRILHRSDLDEVSPDHPVMLRRICRHAIIANSKALELANISKELEDPAGGVIVRDQERNPTGYLLDQAQELVLNIAPSTTVEELEFALQTSIKDCYQKGLVGAHTEDLSYYGSLENTLEAFQRVLNNGLKFRSHLLVHHLIVDEFQQKKREIGEFGEFGAMKIFADGALGGRTALLSFPYKDEPETSGVAIHTKKELEGLVQKARQYKMEVAVHVIGDLAFQWTIEIIKNNPPLKGQHDRLIHAQILRKDLIEKAKNLPIILDIQPRFVTSDFPWVIDRIGEEHLESCYAWKTLLNEGIHCAGGSDAPIEPVDPLLGIHAAVTRTSDYEETGKSYLPEEKLSMYEAVELFTKGSAYAIHHERDRGMIKKGYTADFTILDQDIFTIEPDKLLSTNVMMTVVDNEVVYKKNALQIT
ncbi:amidohydrolase [Bacillus sp. AFS040349]|uniref:amidohydrolase n=1 Tax=Bacillus sp. AFS040349 TaxID=2033502 RepID=UPI000BFE82AF|nr:amidohydrolase [Bacillus sp. AFS040349]PGT91204.1 amidohydrolase [Bacillus sp. AFS040349]